MKNGHMPVSVRNNFLEVLKVGHFGVPLFTLAAGVILLAILLADPEIDFSQPQSPGLWPRAMIIGLIIVAVITLLSAIYDAWRVRTLRRRNADVWSSERVYSAAPDKHITDKAADIIASAGAIDVDHDNRRVVLGIVGIVGYAVAVEVIGFLLATLAIIAYWMVIWGVHSVPRIALTSVIGTGCILTVFLKIAYLPLPKGIGIFDDVTVYLYRILHLF